MTRARWRVRISLRIVGETRRWSKTVRVPDRYRINFLVRGLESLATWRLLEGRVMDRRRWS